MFVTAYRWRNARVMSAIPLLRMFRLASVARLGITIALIVGIGGATIAATTTRAWAAETGGRTLLKSRKSLYNNIYIYKDGSYVTLTFGYNRALFSESSYNTLDDTELPFAYTRYMTAGLIYPKKLDSILEIGFGGGRTASYLHHYLPNVSITSVELDPVVVELSRKYFGIKNEPNFQVVNSDGRLYLSLLTRKYDLIMIDAYRGPFVPFHLLTKEFYELVKKHLAEGGAVAQNIEPTTMLFDSAVKTIQSVFPQIEFYMAEGNIVTVAYDGPPRSAEELAQVAQQRQAQYQLRYALPAMLEERRPLAQNAAAISPNAKVLTDDFAPAEALKAIEMHNRKWTEQK